MLFMSKFKINRKIINSIENQLIIINRCILKRDPDFH